MGAWKTGVDSDVEGSHRVFDDVEDTELQEIAKELKGAVKLTTTLIKAMTDDDEFIDAMVAFTMKMRDKFIKAGIDLDMASQMATGLAGAVRK